MPGKTSWELSSFGFHTPVSDVESLLHRADTLNKRPVYAIATKKARKKDDSSLLQSCFLMLFRVLRRRFYSHFEFDYKRSARGCVIFRNFTKHEVVDSSTRYLRSSDLIRKTKEGKCSLSKKGA